MDNLRRKGSSSEAISYLILYVERLESWSVIFFYIVTFLPLRGELLFKGVDRHGACQAPRLVCLRLGVSILFIVVVLFSTGISPLPFCGPFGKRGMIRFSEVCRWIIRISFQLCILTLAKWASIRKEFTNLRLGDILHNWEACF